MAKLMMRVIVLEGDVEAGALEGIVEAVFPFPEPQNSIEQIQERNKGAAEVAKIVHQSMKDVFHPLRYTPKPAAPTNVATTTTKAPLKAKKPSPKAAPKTDEAAKA